MGLMKKQRREPPVVPHADPLKNEGDPLADLLSEGYWDVFLRSEEEGHPVLLGGVCLIKVISNWDGYNTYFVFENDQVFHIVEAAEVMLFRRWKNEP